MTDLLEVLPMYCVLRLGFFFSYCLAELEFDVMRFMLFFIRTDVNIHSKRSNLLSNLRVPTYLEIYLRLHDFSNRLTHFVCVIFVMNFCQNYYSQFVCEKDILEFKLVAAV